MLWMRLETASASSVANSELDLCDIPSFLEVLGRDVRIPPKHNMYTDKCHLICYDKQEPNLVSHRAQWAQKGGRAQAQVPAHHNEEELSHPLYTNTPGPWTSMLWPQQGIESQTPKFTTFLAIINTALNL